MFFVVLEVGLACIRTDHARPRQFHVRSIVGEKGKGGCEGEEKKRERGERGLPFIWIVI